MSYALNHVHFRCRDFRAAARFYEEMFSARETDYVEVDGWPILKLDLTGTTLAFSPLRQGETAHEGLGWGMFHLGLQVPDIEAAVAELKAKGAEFSKPIITRPSGLKVTFMAAPDNMEVELMQLP